MLQFPTVYCMEEAMKKNKTGLGAAAVAAAYVMWGMLTLYWNLLTEVNPVYILAQRIIWSMVFMGIYLAVIGGIPEIKRLFKQKSTVFICFICGILVTINWGVYIYAINSGHVLDASLGYFIEPVLVALIGIIAFKERPDTLEKITFVLAFAGLVYMIAKTETFPVLSLLIAGSFAIYGAVKKNLKVTPQASLFSETLFMTPFALIFAIIAEVNGIGSMGVISGWKLLLLPACGIVTSVPLLLFNIGVKKIPYYLSGIIMYINPTIQFLVGIFFFREPMDRDRLVSFIIIWAGVLLAVIDKIIIMHKERLNK